MTRLPLGEHTNAFGFLRLTLAVLVIVAHTPELADGNRHREILSSIFGTTTFGGLAVNGFFVISGFLITASYISSCDPVSYLKKRVTRIYPGFLVAYLLCIILVAPLGGASFSGGASDIGRVIVEAVFLQPPRVVYPFPGMPYPALNGAMWTIAYEFRCYLVIMGLGMLGLLRSRQTMLALTLAITILTLCLPERAYHAFQTTPEMLGPVPWPRPQDLLLGSLRKFLGLLQVFMVGSCLYLYRDKLKFSPARVLLALLLLSPLLFSQAFCDIAISLFFGYFLIGFAYLNTTNIFTRINNKEDISYGVYLAGWPVEKLLLWWRPELPLVPLAIAAIVLSLLYGFASWRLVERPVMKLGRTRRMIDVSNGGGAEGQ